MKRILILLILCCLISVPYSQAIIKDESIVLNTTSGDIYGTLKLPQSDSQVPLAIIIAGSGPTDRDGNQPSLNNNSLKLLSEALYANGIATLCFDKRGVGESMKAGQDESKLLFDDYINDVRGWVELLAKDDRFSSIDIIGHSEGALIGLIASENNDKVSKYISIAGAGEPIANILRAQLEPQLEGQPEEVKNQIFSYIDLLNKGQQVEDVPPSLYALFRPSIQPYMISWFKYNPQKEIAKLSIPILIIHGGMDMQISDDQVDLLVKANPKAQKVIIESMNHLMKDSTTRNIENQMRDLHSDPTQPLNKDLISNVVNFIKQ